MRKMLSPGVLPVAVVVAGALVGGDVLSYAGKAVVEAARRRFNGGIFFGGVKVTENNAPENKVTENATGRKNTAPALR